MAVPQKKLREVVLQLLYCDEIGKIEEQEIIPFLMAQLALTKKAVKGALEWCAQVIKCRHKIDPRIGKVSQSYEFSRIQCVERNVLRLAVYELLYDDGIPPKVAIAEGVRLARKFSTPEAASFVNAILDNIYKADLGESSDEESLCETIEALKLSEEIAQEASQEK